MERIWFFGVTMIISWGASFFLYECNVELFNLRCFTEIKMLPDLNLKASKIRHVQIFLLHLRQIFQISAGILLSLADRLNLPCFEINKKSSRSAEKVLGYCGHIYELKHCRINQLNTFVEGLFMYFNLSTFTSICTVSIYFSLSIATSITM